ncbi:MAG: hypothetical protein HY276_10435 [Ignavibacteriales bacterium]|nr:hypothetical protein [Ignavibacteriales bacterium]
MPTKIQIFASRVDRIKSILTERLSPKNAENLSEQLVRGAEGGLELEDFESWIEKRLKPQLVWLDNDDYTRAITRALPQALRFAASDFGSSRQRDLGQLWTDTARGFLGEIAFQRFLKEKLSVIIEHDISLDKTRDEYISTDIKTVRETKSGYVRPPKINVSIKTGKFNARWMDEYSASKTEKIDVFVFVRVGTVREHFIAFLKAISFLGTKLFPAAERLGELTSQTREDLWNSIPEFEPVPAYIAGYLIRKHLSFPIHSLHVKATGKKNKRITITQGVGNFSTTVLREDPRIKAIDPVGKLPLIIDGIGSEVDENLHFYANTGALAFGLESWRNFVGLL